MTLRVAVQMDPIERINIKGDSTFALMLEAQKRGHSLFYYLPTALAMLGGRVEARGADVTVAGRDLQVHIEGERGRQHHPQRVGQRGHLLWPLPRRRREIHQDGHGR